MTERAAAVNPHPPITLVLLPGMDGTGILFEPFVAAIADRINVKVVSYPATVPMRYSELENYARAALPEAGPFVILGESYSGPIAIALAKNAPARLKGLILCSTFARNPRPMLNTLRALIPLIPAGSVPPVTLNFFLFGRFATPPLTALAAKAVAQVARPVRRLRLEQLLTLDVSQTLASLDLPILCLRASEDRVIPARESEYIANLNPRVRLAEIEASHMLLQTAPAEAARVIASFIGEVGPDR